MGKSITETLKKINIDMKGSSFLSIFSSLILIASFTGFLVIKAYSAENSKEKTEIVYTKSNFIGENKADNSSNLGSLQNTKHYIYASKRGKKYYYWNCGAIIKEANKIYFATDAAAQKAGYTLSKTCK